MVTYMQKHSQESRGMIRGNRKIPLIDEPFKGLNNEEIYTVAQFLSRLEKEGKTIIVVDHEVQSFSYFTKHIILQNKDGILCEST